MIAALLSALILIQPMQPTEQPADAPVVETEVAGEATVAQAAPAAEVEVAAAEPEEERICRRRMIPANGIGQRFRTERVCKTREEWAEDSRRRR
jgi:hypothetical protein